jgi:hypothetical protein
MWVGLVALALAVALAALRPARTDRPRDEALIKAVFQTFSDGWNTRGFPGPM